MKFIVLPVVYVLTLGLFPLFLYWYTSLYVYCLFDQIPEKDFYKYIEMVQQ